MPPSQSTSTPTPTPTPTPISPSADKKKRKRVSRACDQCFQKKDRCDGVQPICTICTQLHRACTYDRPERKRGPTQGLRPRLEQRILALETMLGYMVSRSDTSAYAIANELNRSSDKQRSRWRDEGWVNGGLREELDERWGLKDVFVSNGSSGGGEGGGFVLTRSNKVNPRISSLDEHEHEHEHAHEHAHDSDTDYSDVDLSLPASHQPTQPPASFQTTTTTTITTTATSALNVCFPPGMPLLSSGKGGSSLNRGLVPRGADPNAALGGFEIEFGGSQTDEDWVRSFIPPCSMRNAAARRTDDHARSHTSDSSARPH